MNFLIVHAHPEPLSFASALKDTAVATLTAAGHQVTVSDLHALHFDPVPRKEDFALLSDPSHFRYNNEQVAAVARGSAEQKFQGFAAALAAELGKLDRADVLIFTAPVWWYALPAIAKGWIDKVLAQGWAYDYGKTFDKGLLQGKRALLALTTGGPEAAYVPGAYGTLNENFFPLQYGTLWYCGMTVLEPFTAWGASWTAPAQRSAYLEAWTHRLTHLEASPILYPAGT